MKGSDRRSRKLNGPRSFASKLIIFIFINAMITAAVHFFLAQPSILQAELKQIQGSKNYDVIFVGNSHGETALDPWIIKRDMGVESYNVCRRIMPVTDIFYLMKEVCQKNHPSTIVYEIDPYYWSIGGVSYGNDTSLFHSGRTPWIRAEYFFDVMLDQPFADTFADYRLATRNLSQIPGTVKVKLSPEYRRRSPASIPMTMSALHLGANYEYMGRGFRYGIGYSQAMDRKYSISRFKKSSIRKENLTRFSQMAAFCREKGIRLVCLYSALPPFRLVNENQNDAHDYFAKLCADEGVEYYDMNLAKTQYLGRTDADYVDVDGHMLGPLAVRQTALLADVLMSDSPQQYFYDSYGEMLAALDAEGDISGVDRSGISRWDRNGGGPAAQLISSAMAEKYGAQETERDGAQSMAQETELEDGVQARAQETEQDGAQQGA